MSLPNYESKWWGYIYDQMMTQDLLVECAPGQKTFDHFISIP
jgi:hypothetical protein